MEITIPLEIIQCSYAAWTIQCLNREKFATGVKTIYMYVLFQAYRRGKIALLAHHISLRASVSA